MRIGLAAALLVMAAPALAQDAAKAEIGAAVAAEWAKYDQGGKGHLTRDEFATWLTALRSSAGKKEDPARVKAWAEATFPKSDANGDARVTPEELTAFLQTKVRPEKSSGGR